MGSSGAKHSQTGVNTTKCLTNMSLKRWQSLTALRQHKIKGFELAGSELPLPPVKTGITDQTFKS